MPPIDLLDVTVVAVDSVAQPLTKLAIEDTLREIRPAEILWFEGPDRTEIDHGTVPYRSFDWPASSLNEVTEILWYTAFAEVNTSHFLVIQWDGWVLDGSHWNPDWLKRDYIGAPWWYGDGLNVGNGGFSLRSVDLARWVAANSGRYPVVNPEDEALCRVYRLPLEREGFSWATQEEAEAFAFERTAVRPTFGFHGAWHFPKVLDRDGQRRRAILANDYVRGTVQWREMMAGL